jgi:hypothetical protein
MLPSPPGMLAFPSTAMPIRDEMITVSQVTRSANSSITMTSSRIS